MKQNTQQTQLILVNLTELEKSQLSTIEQKIRDLKMPAQPSRSVCDGKSDPNQDEKVRLEFNQYQTRCQDVLAQQENLEQQRQELLLKGDMAKRCPLKKISPYRVYKRESAPHIKAEYPNMSNEERAQIVRQRWQTISDSLKCVYVTLARFEQESDHQKSIQEFYKERIETAKAHAERVKKIEFVSSVKLNRLQCFEEITQSSDKRQEIVPAVKAHQDANSTSCESMFE